MANKITTVVDFVTESAKSSLASLKTSLAEAEGAGGKLKAGFASIKDSITQHAGAIATIGGAALVEFGIKSVEAFENTALAARDLGTATGLTVEDASRWIGVAKDMGVSADGLTSGLGKIAKTLDDKKWANYGIATRDAGGEARSTNDILIDTFAMLGRVGNETERARIGNELFGKGFKSLSPLIGKTGDEYKKMLDTVESGQVITQQELDKAEKMHKAQQELSQAIHEVTLQIGQEVAGLAPLIVALAKIVGLATEALGPGGLAGGGKLTQTDDALHALRDEIEKGGGSIGDWTEKIMSGKVSLEEATKQIHAAAEANKSVNDTLDGGEKSWEVAIQHANEIHDTQGLAAASGKDLGRAEREAAAAAELAAEKTKAYSSALQEQLDKLDALYPKQYDAVQAKYAFRDAQAAALIATDNLNHATGDTSDEMATAKQAILDAAKQYGGLEGAADGSEGSIRRQIASLQDQEANLKPDSPLRAFLDSYIADLKSIPSNISTIMDLHISSGAVTTKAGDTIGQRTGAHAGGGLASGVSLVGEQGPELVDLPTGSNVHTADATASMLQGGGGGHVVVNLTVNAGLGVQGRPLGLELVDLLKQTFRQYGVTAP